MSDSSHYSDDLSNEDNINSEEETYEFSNITDELPKSPNVLIEEKHKNNDLTETDFKKDESDKFIKTTLRSNSSINMSSSMENIIDTPKSEKNEDEDILIDKTKEGFKNFSVNDKHYVNVSSEILKMEEKRFEYEKSIFVKHLQKKIDGIDKRMRYINHKYADYQIAYKYMNGFVIVLSSTLTLFEALKNILDQNDFNEFAKTIFGIAPLVASTLVSLMATLIKFQKYQEHMEALSITEEKGIIAISKLKRVRELVYFSKNINNLEDIKKTYLDETNNS